MSIFDELNAIKNDSNYRPTLLQEAYYGKNATLQKCDQLFDTALRCDNPTTAKARIKKAEVILKEMFGFKDLVLSTLTLSLASTIPITTWKFKYITKSIEMEKTDTGVKFKEDEGVEAVIFLDMAACKRAELTGSEITSLVLHEIGHSMRTILPSSWLYSSVVALSSTVSILPMILINFGSKTIVDFNRFIDELVPEAAKRFISEVEHTIIKILKYLTFKGILKKIISFFISGGKTSNPVTDSIKMAKDSIIGKNLKAAKMPKYLKMLYWPINIITGTLAFKDEVLADNISTMYGYGPELLASLRKYEASLTSVVTDNVVTRLYKLPLNIVNIIFNPHPQNISRFKLVIENLDVELKKSINEDAYADISKDIAMVKTELKKYEAAIDEHPIANADLIIYRKIMNKLLNGHTDIRAIFLNLTPNDMAKLDGLEPLPVTAPSEITITECASIVGSIRNCPKSCQNQIIDFICE